MKKRFFNIKSFSFIALALMLLPTFYVSAQSTSPLCFTARNGSVDVKFHLRYSYLPTIQYSTDSINWNTYVSDSIVTINANGKIYFRAESNQLNARRYCTNSQSSQFSFSSNNGGTVEGSGNIMSLYGPDCPDLRLGEYEFRDMFRNCTLLTTAPELPATTLSEGCYYSMFFGCSLLISAPALNATTLKKSCYDGMFWGCTSLQDAPALPALEMKESCYDYMFADCSSLTTAPSLPATNLAWYCYRGMFSGCTSLVAAPDLPATLLHLECYNGMFSGCTSLTTLPTFPLLTLNYASCSGMFSGCSSLILNVEGPGDQWSIPADTANEFALTNMFTGTKGTMRGTPTENTIYYNASSLLFTLSATANDSTMGGVSGSGLYHYNDTVALTATPNEGYVFTGWSNGETNPVIYLAVVSDTAIVASFDVEETGVDNSEGNIDIAIYPNPIHAGCEVRVNIDDRVSVIEVYNADGYCIQHINPIGSEMIVSGLNTVGVYFIKVKYCDGKIVTEKLIVE